MKKLLLGLFCCLSAGLPAVEHGGQLTFWHRETTAGQPNQLGVRYLPDFFWDKPLPFLTDADIALNIYNFTGGEQDWKFYRFWTRYTAEQWEVRVGLQKINFGSATLFRPLQWFDTIDPLDPLGFTESVKGLLVRYYLPNNANFWLWGLYGNEELKGSEIIPTKKQDLEFGGRLQLPLFNGEAGLTYHQRRLDFGRSPTFSILSDEIAPERRVGLDGKWDLGLGVWLEAAKIEQETASAEQMPKEQFLTTIGADYTFAIGNGLHILLEKFNQDSPAEKYNRQMYGLLIDYPLDLYDKLICLRQFNADGGVSQLSWQRVYDDLVLQVSVAQQEKNNSWQVNATYNY
ncbi:hypothetical protein NO2_0322 [Candidatus Termititenax persephonae]|uniref:Uncharacterized protein n=1 Tax=Candidatus Termititenax persephonae TaxID=2218525 RepID=A0A388TG88_9BACT|nr:hypothetical protein NO2_0322 [Candidatus Termititenax persephonae]